MADGARLLRPQRSQLGWDQAELDSQFDPDHRAWLVWDFVKTLELGAPMKPQILAAIGETGLQPAASLPATDDDLVDPDAISAMMHAGHDGAGSLHRLVMERHKQLNAMRVAPAEETLDGAAAYNLAATDRPFVTAFMTGINRIAKLKIVHPGVATTATRAGGRPVIQNDIGTTDAHVIVIHVQDMTVSVTYIDVHPERLV
jgi:hypothetical protein